VRSQKNPKPRKNLKVLKEKQEQPPSSKKQKKNKRKFT
jgi:hypothetical protein